MILVLYISAALTLALGIYYGLRNFPADLVLLGLNAILAASWLLAGVVFFIHSRQIPLSDPITFWGYVLTGLAMPIGGIYFGFLERSRWGSVAIAAIAFTCIFLAMRLPQIWPEGF